MIPTSMEPVPSPQISLMTSMLPSKRDPELSLTVIIPLLIEQPFASVTSTVYVPAAKLESVLLVGGVEGHDAVPI